MKRNCKIVLGLLATLCVLQSFFVIKSCVDNKRTQETVKAILADLEKKSTTATITLEYPTTATTTLKTTATKKLEAPTTPSLVTTEPVALSFPQAIPLPETTFTPKLSFPTTTESMPISGEVLKLDPPEIFTTTPTTVITIPKPKENPQLKASARKTKPKTKTVGKKHED